MKPASIADIKKELVHLDAKTLATLCLRLAKHKVENKELLTYLLFEAENEHAYVEAIKSDIDEQFEALRHVNLYQTKKSLRKILRVTNKQIRFSGDERSELELRLHFCTRLRKSGIAYTKSPVLVNMYEGQRKKIKAVVESLPEDLQLDYAREITAL